MHLFDVCKHCGNGDMTKFFVFVDERARKAQFSSDKEEIQNPEKKKCSAKPPLTSSLYLLHYVLDLRTNKKTAEYLSCTVIMVKSHYLLKSLEKILRIEIYRLEED